MNHEILRELLNRLVQKEITVDQVIDQLKKISYQDIGFAKINHHRTLRCGFPEVVFCEGKKPEHAAEIFQKLCAVHRPVLATRADKRIYETVKKLCPDVCYFETARCLVYAMPEKPVFLGRVLVVSAGTADLPVAEEAVICAQAMGNPAERLFDVGVAGLHRLLENQEYLRQASVIIVVAGMEGALPSIIGGLTDRPVIAVPTSVGYGSSFKGLSALLGMLNSCAPGVAVMNIDNGFGAAALATAINRLILQAKVREA